MDVSGSFALAVLYADVTVGVESTSGTWWPVLSLLMSSHAHVCEIAGHVSTTGGWAYRLVSGFGITVFSFAYLETSGGIG